MRPQPSDACAAAQVASLGLSSPTEIQKAVIPQIIEGKNLVMASHTGSGKTLAFLLPLVSAPSAASQLLLILNERVLVGSLRRVY